MMADIPKRLSDSAAWEARFIRKYAEWPRFVLIPLMIFCIPFVIAKWIGEHGEAIMDVLSGEREP